MWANCPVGDCRKWNCLQGRKGQRLESPHVCVVNGWRICLFVLCLFPGNGSFVIIPNSWWSSLGDEGNCLLVDSDKHDFFASWVGIWLYLYYNFLLSIYQKKKTPCWVCCRSKIIVRSRNKQTIHTSKNIQREMHIYLYGLANCLRTIEKLFESTMVRPRLKGYNYI